MKRKILDSICVINEILEKNPFKPESSSGSWKHNTTEINKEIKRLGLENNIIFEKNTFTIRNLHFKRGGVLAFNNSYLISIHFENNIFECEKDGAGVNISATNAQITFKNNSFKEKFLELFIASMGWRISFVNNSFNNSSCGILTDPSFSSNEKKQIGNIKIDSIVLKHNKFESFDLYAGSGKIIKEVIGRKNTFHDFGIDDVSKIDYISFSTDNKFILEGKRELEIDRLRRTFAKLKSKSIESNFTIEANDFNAIELDIYRRNPNRIKFGDKFLLYIEKHVSNFKTSWISAMVWLLIVNTVIYIILIILLGEFHINLNLWFTSLDPLVNLNSYLKEKGYEHFNRDYISHIDFIRRIFILFFAYEIIKSFRKFSR
ncbi:MAG: hypothetical protein OXU73_02495 [Candidatus Campbellbacteria bacterium]|nr:hypothetical protein [Candidatus Campbellbacteria bacterium]